MKNEDLTGMKFGRLTAVECIGRDRNKKYMWRCICDCGKQSVVAAGKLKSGHTKSCGCYHDESAKMRANKHRTHGLTFSEDGKQTRLYRIWTGMKTRCLNPNSDHYKDYMGRGISICDEWRNDFKAFHNWALANGYRDNLSIDRKDPDGNYCPENCRWATKKEQANNKRVTPLVEFDGEKRTLKELSLLTGVAYQTLFWRYKHGWPADKIINGN